MVREPRRIISGVTELTGSGSPGGPGVLAPSPALERTEFWGRNLVSVNALQLNTVARIVIELGIERVSHVQEPATVPWTAIGILGVNGETVVGLVVEDRELELDSVTDLGMEERNVLERQKKRRDATNMNVLVLGAPRILWTL